MCSSKSPRIVFATHRREWYADLISRMEQRFRVDIFHVPYLFEQQHSSKWNVLIDSVALLLFLPLGLAIKGRGLYVLTSRHLPFLFWFRVLSALGLKYRVVAMNFYFHGMREKKLVRKILGFLLNNENLTVIAPSRNDYNYFRSLSDKVVLRYVIFGLEKAVEDFDVKDDGYIFCGGYNNRDFDLVFNVAAEIDAKFVVITSGRAEFSRIPPPNVELIRDVDSAVFDAYMAKARIVLIPLKNDVGASGQIVTLTSMLFGKSVVYTDYDVVSEYFENNVTGLACKAGDSQDLKNKIELLMDDSSLRKRLGKSAKESCENNFTSSATNQRIVDVLSEHPV